MQEFFEKLSRQLRFWLSLVVVFLLFLTAVVPDPSLLDSVTVLLSGLFMLLPRWRRIVSRVAQAWLMVRKGKGDGRQAKKKTIIHISC